MVVSMLTYHSKGGLCGRFALSTLLSWSITFQDFPTDAILSYSDLLHGLYRFWHSIVHAVIDLNDLPAHVV